MTIKTFLSVDPLMMGGEYQSLIGCGLLTKVLYLIGPFLYISAIMWSLPLRVPKSPTFHTVWFCNSWHFPNVVHVPHWLKVSHSKNRRGKITTQNVQNYNIFGISHEHYIYIYLFFFMYFWNEEAKICDIITE